MTARRLSTEEIDAILRDRRAAAEAASKGRAHRALPLCTGNCDQGRRACSCPTGRPVPAEACTEIGAEPQPLTPGESLRFWLVCTAPAFVGVLGFALLVWWAKP